MFTLRSAVLAASALLPAAAFADGTIEFPAAAELRTVYGETLTLGEVAGEGPRAVAVVFVGVECPLVRVTVPRLRELAATGEVRVILVDANRQDSLSDLEAFRDRHELAEVGIPVLKDPGNALADELAATRTPETFLFGPAGNGARPLRYRGRIDDRYGVGVTRAAATRDDFGLALASVLAGEPVEVPATEVEGCKIGRARTPDPDAAVTWAAGPDGSPGAGAVIFEHCAPCHRPGEAAPFALLDYDEAAGWGEMLAEVVADGRMPPWHADPAHGTFSNDARLSPREKETLLAWVTSGCPEGDPALAPDPPTFAEGWRIGEPDEVFAMADEPFAVPAEGTVDYQYFRVDPGFDRDRYVVAAEPRPGAVGAVHHVIVRVLPPGDRPRIDPGDALIGYAPGLPPMRLKPGQAFKIAAGSRLLFEMHYTATGRPERDLSRVGLKYASPEAVAAHLSGETPLTLVKSVAVINPKFEIPPGDPRHVVTASREVPRDLTILALTPHMHFRGASFRYDLTTPDGQTATLLDVPEYDFNWQHRYDLAEPLRVAAGSQITCTASFDNSPGNPANPDPTATVRWGEQSWEEMMIGFLLVAVD